MTVSSFCLQVNGSVGRTLELLKCIFYSAVKSLDGDSLMYCAARNAHGLTLPETYFSLDEDGEASRSRTYVYMRFVVYCARVSGFVSNEELISSVMLSCYLPPFTLVSVRIHGCVFIRSLIWTVIMLGRVHQLGALNIILLATTL